MEELSRSQAPEEKTFTNQFVNAVYGILLGYGFCNSMGQIKQGLPEGIGLIFGSLTMLFTILVVCVYWWDWYKNIGGRFKETYVREFGLDMAILVSLESLFFVYESPVAYSFVFFVLSILSLAWVVNYHLRLCNDLKYRKWSEYIHANTKVKEYVSERVAGVVLFGCCFGLAIYLNYKHDQPSMLLSLIDSEVWFQRHEGKWIVFLAIIVVFAVNRLLFFKNRPGLEEDIVQFRPAQEREG